MCSTGRLLFKNKPAAVAIQRKPSPIISSFLNWAEENCRCEPKFVAAAENTAKTETQQTFVNGLLGFITLGIYTPLEARIAHIA